MARLREWSTWGMRVLALALGYFLAGQLGLLHAIQPGYATPIWPASGIALAGILLMGNRVWPGVLLGSFAVNLPTLYDAEHLWFSLGFPLGIASGSTVQAVVGAVLTHRLVGFPSALNHEREVGKLIALVIPLSSLIGATVGVSLLWWAGGIGHHEYGFNWWTWYMGDMIGILIVAPLVMLWAAPQPGWPRRPITVSVLMIFLGLLVMLMVVYSKHREEERIRNSFVATTNALKDALEARMDYALDALSGMRHSHGKFDDPKERDRFERIAKGIVRPNSPVVGLSWLPRIPAEDRLAFEAAGNTIPGKRTFRIQDRVGDSTFVRAENRSEYFPLLYRKPAPDVSGAWGFDFASNAEQGELLRRAAASGLPIASASQPLLQKVAGERLIPVYLPIYQDGYTPDRKKDLSDALAGFLSVILRTRQLTESAWAGFDKTGIDITFLHESGWPGQASVYYHLDAQGGVPDERRSTRAQPFEQRKTFHVAGQDWTLSFVQTRQFQNAQRSVQAWNVLTTATLVTGLFSGIILVLTGRTALITKLIDERTTDLAQSNRTLVQQINERLRVEDELRRSREESRQSEERFRLLVEGTVDYAIFMLDPAGNIVSWNSGAERILGYPSEEIVGRHFSCLHTAEQIEVGRPQQALHEAIAAGRYEDEGWRVRKDGSRLWANVLVTPLKDAAGNLKGFSKITRDLTERKRVEAALQESRHLVDRIAEMIPSILYVYDLHQRCYVFVNNRIQAILGYDPADVKQPRTALLEDNYHPDDLPTMEWVHEQYQTAEDDAVIETEYRMRHANGEWRWLHTYNTIFVRDANGEPSQILGTAQDVTERKRLEQEVLDIAAEEQRRIGQELHDGTGQELTGLCMLADNLADFLREDERKEEQLARRIAQGLRDALGQVRALSRGLVPVEVDAEGLMSSLTDLTNRISELHGVQCVFECAEPVFLEDNFSATQMFRIAQEAITNALKHSQARNIRVTLEARGYYLTLKIIDDGIGMPSPEHRADGTGLRIMRYRAGQIGAQLSVRSGAAGGTVVSCTLFRGIFHD